MDGIWLNPNIKYVMNVPDNLSGISLVISAADWHTKSFKVILSTFLETSTSLIGHAECLDGE